MIIDGIEIPDEKLIDAGWKKPEFEYPLVMKDYNSDLIVEFTSLTEGTVLLSNCDYENGYDSNKWIPHNDNTFWEPCERPDPYKKFKDHIANGGEVIWIDQSGYEYTQGGLDFMNPPDWYRCVPTPTGKELVGKLCWFGDVDNRQKAKDNSQVSKITQFVSGASYPYIVTFSVYNFAWPLTKEELKELS